MNLPPALIGRPYIPGWKDLGPFVAECCLVATLVGLLIAPFFARRRNLACTAVALCGLTLALVCLLAYGIPTNPQPLGGVLVSDAFSMLWKAMLLVFTIGVILLWRATTAREQPEGDAAEFLTLLVGATLGMCLMASTTNLLLVVMSVELASLPSYMLAGFRKTHRRGAEASLKYVLFGAACSAIMIYALTFLYGLYGTLDLRAIAQSLHTAAPAAAHPALLAIALGGLIVGVGFKIAAVPFHFWCPDVFEGASVEVSAFLSVASKGAGLVLLLRLLMTIADAFDYHRAQPLVALAWAIGILGALSATVGNAGAFAQNSVKRLLAYSSIAHAGYMLCALSLLINQNAFQTVGGTSAPAQVILFYLAVYLFMNLGAFAVAAVVYRATGSDDLHAYRGLARRNPVLAHSMLACMVSLIGLPPFAGFVAKINLLLVLIDNGGLWWILVAVIAVNSIASAFYYFRVLRAIYLEPPGNLPPFSGNPLGVAVAVVCGITLVLMLFLASPVSSLTRNYAKLQGIHGTTTQLRR
jgi:NADH-quinone oxidoreductase subunit N